MLKEFRSRISSDRHLVGLLRDSSILYVAGVISIGLTFAQQISTARILGPVEYGLLAAVLSSAALMLLLMDFRSWEAANKLISRCMADRDMDEAARVSSLLMGVDVAFGMLGLILLLLLAPVVAAGLLRIPELTWLVQLYALIIPFRLFSMGVPTSLLRLYDRFDWLAAKSVIYSVLRLVLMTGAALLGLGLPGVVAGAIVGEVVNAAMLFVLVALLWRRQNPGVTLFRLALPHRPGSIFRLMASLWTSGSLKGLQQEIIIPLLALLTTPGQVGLFRSGMDVAQLVLRLVEPLSITIQPKIMKLYEMDTFAAFIRFIKQSTALLAVVIWPFTIFLILLGPVVIVPFLGEDYAGVWPIASLISAAFAVIGTFSWTRPALVSLNAVGWEIILDFGLLVLTAAGMFGLAPEQGALGAAVVIAVCFILYVAAALGIVIWVMRVHQTRAHQVYS